MSSIFSTAGAEAIESELEQYFKKAITQSRDVGSSYERLWSNLYELMESGGKRFRPRITLLAYELFGGQEAGQIIPIAAAQELLHFSLLIHDDIIDRDYVRHGVPNIAGRYMSTYRKHLTKEQGLIHFSHSAALLGGDLMLAGAYQLIGKSNVSDEHKKIAYGLLSKGLFDVSGGELLDTEASFLPHTPGGALTIALYKTARYSFVTPLLTGAKLAHCGAKQEASLREYAEALGIAYQLVDDLLGVFGNESITGKSTVSDIKEGKQTYLIEKAMETLTPEEKSQFSLAFGNAEATHESIHQAKQLLISSGAKRQTERAISAYKAQAIEAASRLDLASEGRHKLIELARIVIERQR